MNNTSLKQKFGSLMREQVLRAHLRQSDVAKMLKISNSAVSQMLSGKIVPNQSQLEKFAEKAAMTRLSYLELASMLSRIKAGYSHLRSPFNQLVFALRCQNSLSRAALAGKCGVATARIRALETDFQAVPDETEIVSLATALNVPAEDLIRCLRLTGDAALMTSPDAVNHEVRESPGAYRAGNDEIEIDFSSMTEFSAGQNILEFAKRHGTGNYPNPPVLPVPTVALTCPGSALSLLWDGKVVVHLSPERPESFFQVEFCRMADGSFRLRELKGRTWRDFAARSRRKANEKVLWAVPVLEFSFLPEK